MSSSNIMSYKSCIITLRTENDCFVAATKKRKGFSSVTEFITFSLAFCDTFCAELLMV